jgi:hypothetical protein
VVGHKVVQVNAVVVSTITTGTTGVLAVLRGIHSWLIVGSVGFLLNVAKLILVKV